MDWYKGGVVKAIEQCRQQRAVFIVYIKDDTEASSQTDQSWNSNEVLQVLSSNIHVAIELVKGSVEYHQFSQLFPVLLTPCVFCIGLRGDQLAVRSGALDDRLLATTLQEAFQKHQGKETNASNSVSLEDSTTTSGGTVNETVSTDGDESDKQQRLEERKRQVRQRREEDEKQKEKDREAARRREGQEIGQWKKDKEELEKQQWIKERRKQKLEEQKAKQEILAKLEQDRRERAAQKKLSNPKEGGGATQSSQATPTVTSDSARIQIKMPQNKTTVLILSSSDTVGTLRAQIAEYMEVESDSITLLCTYPRKELSMDLDSTQLTEHGLVPSGVVIVRMTNSMMSSPHSSSSNDGSILAILWGVVMGLVNLLIMIGVYIKNGVMSLFGAGTNSSNSQQSSSSSQYSNNSRSENSSRIRRFNQDDFKDDDDEKRKNTYNGNSTQQL